MYGPAAQTRRTERGNPPERWAYRGKAALHWKIKLFLLACYSVNTLKGVSASVQAATAALFHSNLIRIDWLWPASRSSPTLLLCFIILSDYEHCHSFLSHCYLLKWVSSQPVAPVSVLFLYPYVFMCIYTLSFFHSNFPLLFLSYTVSSWCSRRASKCRLS